MVDVRWWAVLVAAGALGLSACSADASVEGAGAVGETAFLDARDVNIEGTWEGVASILTVDSGPMQSMGRYEIGAPVDGVFTVHETLTLELPSELREGAPLTVEAEQDLLGVLAPNGAIRMVKIDDDVAFEGWFSDENTLQMVLTETGEHGVVGTRTAVRVTE